MPLKPAGLAERRPLPKRRQLPSIASQLARFHRRQRTAVCGIAGRHSRLADLARSFPALLFKLAVRSPRLDADAVIAAVIAGKPLPELATAAKLPLWTRKLAPEAFQHPIPCLPDGELFRRRIANHIPERLHSQHRWVWTVAISGHWGSEGFAIWCARHTAGEVTRLDWIPTAQLSLWAWYSQRPELRAAQTIEQRWRPEIGYDTAVEAASNWIETLLPSFAPARPRKDIDYLTSGEFDGFEFVPVNTRAGLAAEAAALNNCLRSQKLNQPGFGNRFFSIRRQGERLAALSVRQDCSKPIPFITQLLARNNNEAPRDIWVAAAKWLACHDLPGITARAPFAGQCEVDHRVWQSLWLPYWKDRKHAPRWLSITPNGDWRWQLEETR